MARKLDSTEPVADVSALPQYRSDVTRSLVRVTSTWISTDYHARFARAAGVPEDPHAVTVLFHIAWNGPMRPSALAATLGLSAAGATRIVETLATAGLVTRTPDPDDARATRIALTEQGVAVSGILHAEGDRLSQRLLADWTEEERTTFTRLLHRYADAVELDARGPRP